MKTVCFDADVAEEVGIEAAIILWNIGYWIEHNAANGQNEHDGRYWTYNSQKAFQELFPFMSAGKIRGALKRLEDGGYILTGNYNRVAYDRTLWYALTEKGETLCKKENLHLQKSQNGSSEICEPIPDDNHMTTSKEPPIAPHEQEDVEEVVSHLNALTGKSFKAKSNATRNPIRARLREGYTVDDCNRVIDAKVADWGRDPKMSKFLRPETLFRASKFEAYLNESPVVDMSDCPF
mgnify:CR=1 FL=1